MRPCFGRKETNNNKQTLKHSHHDDLASLWLEHGSAAGSNPPVAIDAADVPVQDSPGVAAGRQLFGEPFSGGAGPAEEGDFDTVHAHDASALPQPGAGVMRTGTSQAASPAVAAAGTPPRMPMIQKQYIGTPAEQIQKKIDDDAVRVERMQKKIEELEELIK